MGISAYIICFCTCAFLKFFVEDSVLQNLSTCVIFAYIIWFVLVSCFIFFLKLCVCVCVCVLDLPQIWRWFNSTVCSLNIVSYSWEKKTLSLNIDSSKVQLTDKMLFNRHHQREPTHRSRHDKLPDQNFKRTLYFYEPARNRIQNLSVDHKQIERDQSSTNSYFLSHKSQIILTKEQPTQHIFCQREAY